MTGQRHVEVDAVGSHNQRSNTASLDDDAYLISNPRSAHHKSLSEPNSDLGPQQRRPTTFAGGTNRSLSSAKQRGPRIWNTSDAESFNRSKQGGACHYMGATDSMHSGGIRKVSEFRSGVSQMRETGFSRGDVMISLENAPEASVGSLAPASGADVGSRVTKFAQSLGHQLERDIECMSGGSEQANQVKRPISGSASPIGGIEFDRWLRVVVYGLAVSLTSCLFAGWQQYSLILLKGSAYEWKCKGLGGDTKLVENSEIPGLLTCASQEKAVNSLLPLASGMELAGAIVAGVLLDFTGPRLCALIGSVTGFLSYVMLIYSDHQHNFYGASMAITGIAINLIGFPALTLEDYFPTAAATTAAYVIACQCLSSVISVILWEIWKQQPALTFEKLWWCYLLLVWIPVSLPYIYLLPLHRATKSAAEAAAPVEIQNTASFHTAEGSFEDLRNVGSHNSANPTSALLEPINSNSGGETYFGLYAARSAPQQESNHRRIVSSPKPSSKASDSFEFHTLLRYVFSLPYIVMNALSVILMLQNAYYQIIVRPLLGLHLSEFLGWTMPSQAVWALAIGRLVDWTKTPCMIAVIALLYSFIYFLIPLGESNIQYLSLIVFNMAMSYAYTVKYSYVQERYPQRYYGTLVGVSGAVSGVGVFATNILNAIDQPVASSLSLACATFVALPFCVWLHFELKHHLQGRNEGNDAQLSVHVLNSENPISAMISNQHATLKANKKFPKLSEEISVSQIPPLPRPSGEIELTRTVKQ